MYAEATAAYEARESKNHLAQASRLLSAVCDAVVRLDSEWAISEPAPKLASLLLVQDSSRSLHNRSFMDFLPHERDRDQIQAYAEQALRSDMPSSDEPAGSRHVHLRGSHSISIKAEIFMVSFRDFDLSTHHLIGVRECEVEDAVE